MTSTAPTPTIHIVPDKAGSSSESCFSAHLTRSGCRVSRQTEDHLTHLELWDHQFSHCIDDNLWVEQSRPILEGSERPLRKILVEPDAFQLVPKPLFQEEDTKRIIQLTGATLDGKSILFEPLNSLDAVMVWTIPSKLNSMLNESDVRAIADVVPCLISASSRNESLAQVILRPERTEVAIYDQGLQLLSSYNTPTHNDRLYFLVAACESNGLEPAQTKVEISGDSNPEFIKLLSSYFKTVVPSGVPEKVKVPYAFKDHEPSNWSALLNLHLCE